MKYFQFFVIYYSMPSVVYLYFDFNAVTNCYAGTQYYDSSRPYFKTQQGKETLETASHMLCHAIVLLNAIQSLAYQIKE